MAQLWGGRFTRETDRNVYLFNASISYDKRLYRQDIEGSIAHAIMLEKQGILTTEEKDAIVKGLTTIRTQLEDGSWYVAGTSDDGTRCFEAVAKVQQLD